MPDPIIRLTHGDCANILPGVQRGLISATITDPPFGINFQSNHAKGGPRFMHMAGDTGKIIDWPAVFDQLYRVSTDPGCLVCFHRWDVAEDFRNAIVHAGWVVKSQVVWDKQWHGSGDLRAAFAPQHELAWFAIRGHYRFPGHRPNSVIRVSRVSPGALRHPAEKPIELMATFINALTRPGDWVLDPFMGIGSTGCAAVDLERRFYGIEIDPIYFNVAHERITGGPVPCYSKSLTPPLPRDSSSDVPSAPSSPPATSIG
jgi:DNA modification methylase